MGILEVDTVLTGVFELGAVGKDAAALARLTEDDMRFLFG